MPIVIIANDPELEPEGQPQAAPTNLPVQPVSVQPERESQPSLHLDDLYALIRKYQHPQTPTDRDDAIEGIMSHPYQGSTLGSWLKYKLKKSENPQQEAMLMVMYVLDRYLPGEKFFAKLNEEVKGYFGKSHSTGLEESTTKGPQSRTMESAMQRFLPYLKGTQAIDDDISEQFPDKAQQIWEQYRRDAWNNIDNRIDKAKAWVVEQVASRPDLATQFPGFNGQKFKAKDYQIARNILTAAGLAQHIEDPNSPYWLTQEMVDPAKRGIGPGYIEKAFQQGLGGVLSMEGKGADSGENGLEVGQDISSKDIERGRGYSGGKPQDMSETERKELRKNLPESYRSVAPEEKAQEITNRQKFLSLESGYYKPVMTYLSRRLYTPDLTRTDQVCSAILKLMADLDQPVGNKASNAKTLGINRQKMEEMKQQYMPFFERPLNLRDEPEAADEDTDPDRRFVLAWGQVMKDLTRYLSDDKQYSQMLADLGIKTANIQEFRRVLLAMIRRAHFVGLNKYAGVLR